MSFSKPVFHYANLFSPGEQTKFNNMIGWQKNLSRKIKNVLTQLAANTAIVANQLRFSVFVVTFQNRFVTEERVDLYLSQLTLRSFPEEETGAPGENPGF